MAEGDVAALARLVEQSPRGAVGAVARALATPPEDPGQAAELDALALRLCRGLRRAGEPASALVVAAAAGRRSMAMRLEEALAAFASGDDGRAAEVSAADKAVGAVVGPLLGAVRGEVGGPSPSGAAPSLRALHAAARAAAHAVRGEADKARAVVGRIPAGERHAVLAPEIAAAAALGDWRAR